MKTTKEMILVIGPDEARKPHAAKFDMSQADLVRKAAKSMGFRTAIPKSDEAIALADRLPPGKVFASGKGMVPFCPVGTYSKLIEVLEFEREHREGAETAKQAKGSDTAAMTAKAGPEAASPASPNVQLAGTDPWTNLKVGDKVIAPAGKPAEEGWWAAVITAQGKDGRTLTLRWVDAPKLPPFTLKRRAVALLSTG